VNADGDSSIEFEIGARIGRGAAFLLLSFALLLSACGVPIPGDLDGDGDVDKDDLSIVLDARNTPASGPDDPRDLDGDGLITGLDARMLVTLCTLPGCAIPPKVTISTPPDLSFFGASPIVVTGERIDIVEAVTVNGVSATLDGLTWTVTIPLVEGSNTVLAVGRDENGNEGTDRIGVVLDTTPPSISITSPTEGETVGNGQPSITLVWADEIAVDAARFELAANGSELAAACTLTSAGGVCTPAAPLSPGPVALVASIRDLAGNIASAQVGFTVPLPPSPSLALAITEPAEGAIFGASPITVRGEVNDPTAAVLVGDVFATITGTAFEATGVEITEGLNTLTARARNDAREEASATRSVVLDTVPPILSILAPADRSVLVVPTADISGYVSDAMTPTATIDGQPAVVSESSLTGTATLVANENRVTVVARDAAGNTTTEQLTLYLDTVPLAVTGVVPDDATVDVDPASDVVVTFSEPVDPASIGATTFFAQAGARILPAAITVAADGVTATLAPSTALPPGAEIDVTVTTGVTDAAGNPLQTPFRSAFATAGAPSAPTVVIGEVYDDTKSLPLEGAAVLAVDPVTDAVLALTESDELGRYVLSPGRSDILVRVIRPGFTIVERWPSGEVGWFAEAVDARLTPLGEPHHVQAVLPAEISTAAGHLLAIPPGAFDADGDVRLTEIGPQGPRMHFPLGWTPIAILNVSAPEPFDPPATLSMVDRSGLAEGMQAVAARYDPGTASWTAMGDVTMPSDGPVVVGDVSGRGQFALLIPDAGEGAPAPAVADAPGAAREGAPAPAIAGATLAAGAEIALPEDADGTGFATPRVGLVSDATPAEVDVTIEAGSALRSGTLLQGDFFELFVLREGGEVSPLATSQDLVVYRSLDDPDGRTLTARFAIAPSTVFSTLEAIEGRITVTMRRRSLLARDVVGVAGGGVRTDEGSRVVVPPSVLTEDVPLRLAQIAEQDFGVGTPDGLTYLGGLELDLAGVTPLSDLPLTLGGRAEYVPTGGHVVVARIETLRGRAALVPVALARVDGEDLTTFNELGGTSLPGVVEGGRYAFYLLSEPIALVEGTARDEAGGREGLAIRIEGLPFVSTTDASGRFVAVAAVGGYTLVATSASNLDEARVAGTTGLPLPEVVVTTTPPRVERVTVRPPRVDGNFTGPVVLLGSPAPQVDDDASGASSGNGDGVIEAGERIELTLTVRNDGTVAVEDGLFLLDVRGPAGAAPVAPSSLPIETLAPDVPVDVGPFVIDIPAASDPTALRYTLSRFSASGGRPNDLFFSLPLDAEHVNVPVDSEITVEFSEPIDRASLEGGLILTLDGVGGPVAVDAKLLVAPDAASARLRPLEPLADGAVYRVTLDDTIVDRDGLALAQAPVIERIRTQDLTPPGPIDAGNIEASVPDEDGLVTVTGSLGSVNPEDTVLVLNEFTGFVTVATVETDGSFSAEIPAATSDRLQLISLDPYGNEVTTDVGGFVRRDPTTGEVLAVVVSRDGAVVHGPDGIALDVPTGAVAGAAEVAVSRNDAPFALPDDLLTEPAVVAAFEALFSVVDRIEIESTAPRFAAPVTLSLPAPTGAQEGDVFLVARSRLVTVGGALADLDRIEGLTAGENPLRAVERLEIVDSATVKSEGTSLVLSTDSPPFGGIDEPGTLTVLEPAVPLTFFSGEVRRDTVAGRPVSGAVVQSLPEAIGTTPFVAVTDDEGSFVVADEAAGGSWVEGAVVASRLDVSDPLFVRVIRRDVRGVVGAPAPPGTTIAHLEEPFVLPSDLPTAVVDVLGDVEPPTVEIQLAGSSLGQGYAALGDQLTITVVADDNDEVTFVGLEVDEGGGLESVALSAGNTYPLFAFAPGVIQLRARAQDRTGNTTFVDRTLQILSLDAGGTALPPTSVPGRVPAILLPTESTEPGLGEAPPTPVIPDANEISFNGDIVLLFTEPLDPATVNEDTVEVLDPELVPIPIDVTTEFGDSAIRITPKRNMRLGASYEVLLSSAIQDVDGDSFPGSTLDLECPPPEQIATINLPNATDVALLDAVETTDPETGEEVLLEDVLVAVNFPLGSDEPGAIHTYQVRDAEDPELLLEEPILLGSAATNGNPWSLAIDGDRAYVGNAWKGPIVFREGTIGYAKELVSFVLGQAHEVLRVNTGYQWSDDRPNPASNLEVIDLSDPTTPTRVGTKLANFGRLFRILTGEPLWDPNVLPTRVEVTDQGVAMLNHLENIEFFDPEEPFDSTGVLENIWGPGTKPGRCDAGPEEGQMCPVNYSPPFWPCLPDNTCVPTDEFYDAAYFDATESHGAFAVMLQRDQQGAGARLIATDNLRDPLTFDNTISTLPIPAEARSHFGRVGAVQEFEWDEEDEDTNEVTTRVTDLAFVVTPGDRQLRIFDVTDPSAPVEMTDPDTRLSETYGNISFDECTGIAYLHGLDGAIHIVDFNDPRAPIELNDPGDDTEPFRVEGLGATVSFNGNTNDDRLVFLAEEDGIGVVQTRFCTAPERSASASPALAAASATGAEGAARAATSRARARAKKKNCLNVVLKPKAKRRLVCDPVDLDITGIAEKREESPGGLVLLNNDDDDQRATPANDGYLSPDAEQILFDTTWENDLIRIDLSACRGAKASRGVKKCRALLKKLERLGAEAELSISRGAGVKFYEPKEGVANELREVPSLTWKPISEMPDHLFVSGSGVEVDGELHPSTAVGDVELTLEVRAGKKKFTDKVALTVALVQLEPVTSDTIDPDNKIPPPLNPAGMVVDDPLRSYFAVRMAPPIPSKWIVWKELAATAGETTSPCAGGVSGGAAKLNFFAGHRGTPPDDLGLSWLEVTGAQPGRTKLRLDLMDFTKQVCAAKQYRGLKRRVPLIETEVYPELNPVKAEYNLTAYFLCDDDVENCARPQSTGIFEIMNVVNNIYSQVGIRWNWRIGAVIANTRLLKDCSCGDGLENGDDYSCEEQGRLRSNTGGAEVYFVKTMKDADACDTSYGSVVPDTSVDEDGSVKQFNDVELGVLLAHELGHALRLDDIMPAKEHDVTGDLDDLAVTKERVPGDWSNGPGQQHYPTGPFFQSDLVERLLMCSHQNCPVGDLGTFDIPRDDVLGFAWTDEQEMTTVGLPRVRECPRNVRAGEPCPRNIHY